MTLKDLIATDIKNIFLNTDDFADEFVNARTALTISTIFDNEFQVIIDDVETTAPAITVADVDIPGVLHGDIFTRVEDSTVYNVTGIQPDGTGATVLVLSQD